AEVDVVDLEPDRVERPNAADQLEAAAVVVDAVSGRSDAEIEVARHVGDRGTDEDAVVLCVSRTARERRRDGDERFHPVTKVAFHAHSSLKCVPHSGRGPPTASPRREGSAKVYGLDDGGRGRRPTRGRARGGPASRVRRLARCGRAPPDRTAATRSTDRRWDRLRSHPPSR